MEVGKASNMSYPANGTQINSGEVTQAFMPGSSTEDIRYKIAILKGVFNRRGNYANKLEVGGMISEGQAIKKQAEGANVYDSSEVVQTLGQILSQDALPEEGLINCGSLDRLVGRVMTRTDHKGKIVAKAYVKTSSGTSPVQVMVIRDPKTLKTEYLFKIPSKLHNFEPLVTIKNDDVTFTNERLMGEEPQAFAKIFDAAQQLSVTSHLLTSSDRAATEGQAPPSSAVLGEASAALDTAAVASDTATVAAVAAVASDTAAVASDKTATAATTKMNDFDIREFLRETNELRFEMNARAEIFNHDNNDMHFLTFEQTTFKILNGIDQFSQSLANELRAQVSSDQFQGLTESIEKGAADVAETLSECWNGVSNLVSDCGPVVLDGCADCCDATANCCFEVGGEVLCLPFKLLECFGEILTCGGGACFD